MNIPDIPELKKAMEVLKEEDWNIIGSFPQKVKDSLQDILSACQLLCDTSDEMLPKKEKSMGDYEEASNMGYNLAREEDILWITKKMMGIGEFLKRYKELECIDDCYLERLATAIIQSFGQEKGRE